MVEHKRPRNQSISSQYSSYNLYKVLLKELGFVNRDKEKEKEEHDQNTPLISTNESLEQIMNMMTLPFYMEKFMVFGLLTCLNSFLKLLVLLPIKLILDLGVLIVAFRNNFVLQGYQDIQGQANRRYLSIVNLKSLIFASLLIGAILFGINVDTSRIYHTIRAQSSIKLYVMFGVFEITDKLLSTVGSDLLNVLFSYNEVQLKNLTSSKINVLRFLLFYVLGLGYLSLHTVVLIYQTISLNVAANSYSNSLLTLLVSNQFAEIKSSVFKRIDREGLFQMSCADIVERFQLFTMLTIIGLRNLVQIGNDANNQGLLPNSTFMNFNRSLGVIFGPTTIVIGSELLVDWVKHSYVTKFNKIRPKIYAKYLNVLANDVVENFKYSNDSMSDKIQHRLGLPLPALFVLFIVMSKSTLKWVLIDPSRGYSWQSQIVYKNLVFLTIAYVALLVLTLILELVLMKWSNIQLKSWLQSQQLQSSMEDDYTAGLVSHGMGAVDPDSLNLLYDAGESVAPTLNELRQRRDGRTHGNLSQVSRYRMCSKKIW